MASTSIAKNTTWAMALADDSIETVEHPLTEMTLPKDLFYTNFKEVLDQLDGSDMSSYVDFFFERNPVLQTHLMYVDEDSKQDFLDWAIEVGCMPTVKESNQGEDDDVRKARLAKQREEAEQKKAAAAARETQAAKRRAKAATKDPAAGPAGRIHSKLAGLNKLKSKKNAKPEKIARAQESLDADVAAFVANFPGSLALLPLDLVPADQRESVAAAQAAAAAEKEAAKAAAAQAAAAKKAAKAADKAAKAAEAAACQRSAHEAAEAAGGAPTEGTPKTAVAAAAAAAYDAEAAMWKATRGQPSIAMDDSDSDSGSDSDSDSDSDSHSEGSSSGEED